MVAPWLHSTQTDVRVSFTVCAIERTVENLTTVIHPIPIAGEFSHSLGGALNPKWTRMKSSPSNADKEKEGVRLEMQGGKDSDGQEQKAIIEFLCDPSTKNDRRRSLLLAEDEGEPGDDETGEDGDQNGEEVNDGHGGKLKLVSWDIEEDKKILRLDWTTKYGCEDFKDDGTGSKSGHWGEF